MRIRVRPFATLLHFSSLLAAQLSRLHVQVWSYLIVNRVLSRELETFHVRSSRTCAGEHRSTAFGCKNSSSFENNFVLARWPCSEALKPCSIIEGLNNSSRDLRIAIPDKFIEDLKSSSWRRHGPFFPFRIKIVELFGSYDSKNIKFIPVSRISILILTNEEQERKYGSIKFLSSSRELILRFNMVILVLAFGIKCFRHLLKCFGNVVRRTISYDIGFLSKFVALS